ncbi:hypothetical protein CYLTODRAFT_425777 [Cylindrobasidium torrendii FP15055 ss-10]|uniref:Zn(2)-C6 fungal-type domain-containing protein n=1 Tax=Cylindrobasidium torrendii FP15055 ss-10 TaxID=1314674 RepID=A0A0D7AZL1_9AGAR|nr:hypothetical protein CYLTODRAFT_425777 [Cylindrobasidium torrendii FP15055 ss-10]
MADNPQPFMTSSFALEGSQAASSKKRKTVRGSKACDSCRHKKIKCNASPDPFKCYHCISAGLECQWLDGTTRRTAPDNPKVYIKSLEERIASLEKALLEAQESSVRSCSPPAIAPLPPGTPPLSTPFSSSQSVDEEELPEEPGVSLSDLTKELSRLGVKDESVYFGRASGIFLVQHVLGMRKEIHKSHGPQHFFHSIRKEYWRKPAWEQALEHKVTVNYAFPPPDLLPVLVDLYFVNSNNYLPLLHRPTFERAIKENVHLTDQGFAATLLLVCGIGSRYSDDLRVRLDSALDDPYSAGWKYFVQIPPMEVGPSTIPSLYELQKCVLMVFFMMSSSSPRGCWTLVGTGLRFVQDLGVHQRRMPDVHITRAEHERWKRIFWCLVCLDRVFAVAMGRSVALQDEDIDAELPANVDDEYWFTEDGRELFQQPPNVPSKVHFFNSFIQLLQLVVFSLRTVYSMEKTKLRMGFGPEKLAEVVTEMDSALNRWFDAVPDHLRWDPHREDPVFFTQSVSLHAWYYNCQILTHRHFLLTPRGERDSDGHSIFPSLAICTNAARAVLHILHRQVQRGLYSGFNMSFVNALGAAVVLYLNLWSSRNPRRPTSSHNSVFPDVQKAREIMIFMEKRFFSAGRFLDILNELGYLGEPNIPSGPSAKRRRDSQDFEGSESQGTSSSVDSAVAPETFPAEFMQMPFGLDFASIPADSTAMYDPVGTSIEQLFSIPDHRAPAFDASGSGSASYTNTAGGEGEVSGMEGLWDAGNAFPLWPTAMDSEDWTQYLVNMSEWSQMATGTNETTTE